MTEAHRSADQRFRQYPVTEQEKLAHDRAMLKARITEVLREHWLTGVQCNHEASTDMATCFCSHWRSSAQPSVGAAVERWIEHVLEQL